MYTTFIKYNFIRLNRTRIRLSLQNWAYPERTKKKLRKIEKIGDALRDEPATFIVIHKRTDIRRSTLSGLLKEMVKHGILEKEENLFRLAVPYSAFTSWVGAVLSLYVKYSKVGRSFEVPNPNVARDETEKLEIKHILGLPVLESFLDFAVRTDFAVTKDKKGKDKEIAKLAIKAKPIINKRKVKKKNIEVV